VQTSKRTIVDTNSIFSVTKLQQQNFNNIIKCVLLKITAVEASTAAGTTAAVTTAAAATAEGTAEAGATAA
jgi:hypothetical protein